MISYICFFALLILLIALILHIIIKVNENVIHQYREGFANPTLPLTNALKRTVLKTPETIYDKFYAKVYKNLIEGYSSYRIDYEIDDLIKQTNLQQKTAKLLDLGCGIGTHVETLAKQGYNVIGLDQSAEMLALAQDRVKRYQNARLVEGYMEDGTMFPDNRFTHITCYYFTIYYTEEVDTVLRNIYQWLQPNGYFVVHLVDKYKFDPILDVANVYPAYSVQKYLKQRKNDSVVHFDKFIYRSDFRIKEKNMAEFVETITYTDKQYEREQRHQLYMKDLKPMIALIKKQGFLLQKITNMASVNYEYQYLCYFKKKSEDTL